MDDLAPDASGVEDEGTDTNLDPDAGLDTEGDEGTGVESTEGEGDGDHLDIDEYGDRLVTIKVDGEEITIPLSEALAGHMRHADYTRKTQALAPEREAAATYKALEQAFARDFDGTVAALRQHFGVSPAGNEDEILDPLEREVRELRNWREQQEADRRQQVINTELSALKTQDPDLDERELLSFAIENEIPSLTVAYKAFAFDRKQAATAAAAAAEQERERKVAAKRAAPPVAPGTARNKSGVAQGASAKPTLREIIASALRGED